jgi:hypothetical protein
MICIAGSDNGTLKSVVLPFKPFILSAGFAKPG